MLAPSLYQFFRRHVHQAFGEEGLNEPATIDYVSDVLARFAHTPALYAIRDANDVPIEHIAQMLVEWQRAGEDRRDLSRQALIVRHVGEYSLFMSGLFRERLRARGQLNYYLDHGRSAYWQTADIEPNPRRSSVFRKLYYTLDRVCDSLDKLRRERLPLSDIGVATTAASDDGDSRNQLANRPLAALWRM